MARTSRSKTPLLLSIAFVLIGAVIGVGVAYAVALRISDDDRIGRKAGAYQGFAQLGAFTVAMIAGVPLGAIAFGTIGGLSARALHRRTFDRADAKPPLDDLQ